MLCTSETQHRRESTFGLGGRGRGSALIARLSFDQTYTNCSGNNNVYNSRL